jgi:UDP-GlcNAc3NAcA epimerase
MSPTRILTVVGARPQFVKAAPVSRALAARGIVEVLVHTGQHFDPEMSDVFFAELQLPPPAHHLGIHGGTHGEMTGRMLAALEATIEATAPRLVLVYGDTNSTLAGALAAAKLNIPVAHVEAGLRSFNRRMPEEINRVLVDHASTLLFAPTRTAVANLRREGIERNVHHTGDVMYDAVLLAAGIAQRRSDILERLGVAERGYAVATVHRAENTQTAESLAPIIGFLRAQTTHRPVVLPLHPRTRAAAALWGISLEGLLLSPPLGFLDMQRLVRGAALVMTDSGGLQKEAYFHRVPCLTLREETEWVETIEAGWNRLWRGPDYAPRREIDEYGSGNAAVRIAELLGRFG